MDMPTIISITLTPTQVSSALQTRNIMLTEEQMGLIRGIVNPITPTPVVPTPVQPSTPRTLEEINIALSAQISIIQSSADDMNKWYTEKGRLIGMPDWYYEFNSEESKRRVPTLGFPSPENTLIKQQKISQAQMNYEQAFERNQNAQAEANRLAKLRAEMF